MRTLGCIGNFYVYTSMRAHTSLFVYIALHVHVCVCVCIFEISLNLSLASTLCICSILATYELMIRTQKALLRIFPPTASLRSPTVGILAAHGP